MEDKKGKFVIIDLRNMDFMKDKDGKICYYDSEEYASEVCGIYEFENAWVCELKYNHIEEPDEVIHKDKCPNCGYSYPLIGVIDDEYMGCDACGTKWKYNK